MDVSESETPETNTVPSGNVTCSESEQLKKAYNIFPKEIKTLSVRNMPNEVEELFTVQEVNVSESREMSAVQSDKVSCSDPEQLKKACNIFSGEIKKPLVKNMPNADAERFANRFQEVFNKFIQSAVEINGLPLETCVDESINTVKEKEKIILINETYLPKMGNLLVKVSHQRKSNPSKVVKIMQKRLKQELQNLKDYYPPTSDLQPFNDESASEDDQWPMIQEQFKNFVNKLNGSSKNLQTEIDKVKKINDDIQFAKEVYDQELNRTFPVFTNNDDNE